MFTGIVRATGRILASEPRDGDLRLRIAAGALDLRQASQGDSIAVNGVCLTVSALEDQAFAADVSRETLACTTLADLRPGAPVNLEPALRAGEALGGHLVSGHVDAVAVLQERRQDARSVRMVFSLPRPLAPLVAAKGSICIDGISLTVNAADAAAFEVNLVPHTLQVTIAGTYEPGTRVNIEADMVARYLQRLIAAGRTTEE